MKYVAPYAKAWIAFIAGWLAVNLTPELMVQFNQMVGLDIPPALVQSFVALVIAACVYFTPNRAVA